jgi:CheY-like chemotaxis protein
MSIMQTILLADDDENDLYFAQRAFKEAGIQNSLYLAHDGQEAIDILAGTGKYADRNQYPLPCLLILDLKMPRKTGLDVLRWKRQLPIYQSIPAMILSSSAHRYDVELAYRLGANAFVVKPASTETRTTLARFIKGFWLDFNHPPLACTEGIEEAMRLQDQIVMPNHSS